VSPKTNSPSPAQRSVPVNAQKAISYQFTRAALSTGERAKSNFLSVSVVHESQAIIFAQKCQTNRSRVGPLPALAVLEINFRLNVSVELPILDLIKMNLFSHK
jgi:hypothetical protein